jgi:hypothetical protein
VSEQWLTREERIEQLAKRLAGQLEGLSLDDAQRAAAMAAVTTESDYDDARAYRWLRDEICKTMADPSSWDGDCAEEDVLARYVRHLARASHGNCQRCGRRISATEGFEDLDANLQPIVICPECA